MTPLAGFKGSTFKGKETWGRIWGKGGEGMGLRGREGKGQGEGKWRGEGVDVAWRDL